MSDSPPCLPEFQKFLQDGIGDLEAMNKKIVGWIAKLPKPIPDEDKDDPFNKATTTYFWTIGDLESFANETTRMCSHLHGKMMVTDACYQDKIKDYTTEELKKMKIRFAEKSEFYDSSTCLDICCGTHDLPALVDSSDPDLPALVYSSDPDCDTKEPKKNRGRKKRPQRRKA